MILRDDAAEEDWIEFADFDTQQPLYLSERESGRRQLFLSVATIISFGSFASSTVTATGRDAASVAPVFFFPFSSLSS